MKVSIALLMSLMVNGSIAFAGGNETRLYKVESLNNDGITEFDLSDSDLTLELTSTKFAKSFVLKSNCRTVSGKMEISGRTPSQVSMVDIRTAKIHDNCLGSDVDLLNLRAFLRFGMAKTIAQTENEIQFVGPSGRGVVLKLQTNRNLVPVLAHGN